MGEKIFILKGFVMICYIVCGISLVLFFWYCSVKLKYEEIEEENKIYCNYYVEEIFGSVKE